MRTLAVVNMKGGVGKTTTAVHMAAGFARRGLRTLLVDADPQGNIAHALGLAPGVTLRELMLGEAPIEAAIHAAVRPQLDVIASTTAAFGLESHLAAQVQRETVLTRRLRPLSGYDAVIFDTSPAMSLLTLNVLVYAGGVVVPVGMDSLALVGARQTLTGLAEIQELWPERGLRLAAVLPTAVKPATLAARAALDALDADPDLARQLYRPGIRQCIELTYAAASHATIWEHAPGSHAAEDYDRFVAHLLGPEAEVRSHVQAESRAQAGSPQGAQPEAQAVV